MKKVLTYGTFDLLHHGHIRLLERARALGDHLTVAISTDQFNLGKGKVCAYTYEEREHILKAIRYVDEVIPETQWEQKIEDVKKHEIDVFVMGDDWAGKFDFLADYCEVVYLPRTPDISTTQIKKMLAKKDLAAGQKQIHE
ncbi:glycerol-3-phosphate cytidylyltransferase [Actinobacillus vicugnae]|uniref:glycerol-3-phosphate cytidylyltransferase n=1 Tax=Actinobacillus vicugnae TaxID=2573093 RepID=UPI001241FC3D|nr:glycerol-3-phosphate cytidylyltransferase [Actinobacillus vicugnae]